MFSRNHNMSVYAYKLGHCTSIIKKHMECLEQVQGRATKLISEFKNLSYPDRLQRLKLTTLEKASYRFD